MKLSKSLLLKVFALVASCFVGVLATHYGSRVAKAGEPLAGAPAVQTTLPPPATQPAQPRPVSASETAKPVGHGHLNAKQMSALEKLQGNLKAAAEAHDVEYKSWAKHSRTAKSLSESVLTRNAWVREVADEYHQAYSCFAGNALDEKVREQCQKTKALWGIDSDGNIVVP